MRRLDLKEQEKRHKLYDEGYCDRDIAEKLGKSKGSIRSWRKRQNLPTVFENRKRLTIWEMKQIQNYLKFERERCRVKKLTTLDKHKLGLEQFIMSLKHPLSQVSQEDIENYIIKFNDVDLSRRDELLKTNLATKFNIPNIPVSKLYNFVSRIIAPRIFYRDGGCKNCKSINKLNLHHIKGKFNLLSEYLITLCENCHLSIRHAARRYLIK